MKYAELISDFLSTTDETAGAFAKRAGVHRSSVYRAKAGKDMSFRSVKKMVLAAGGEILIQKASSDVEGNEQCQS